MPRRRSNAELAAEATTDETRQFVRYLRALWEGKTNPWAFFGHAAFRSYS